MILAVYALILAQALPVATQVLEENSIEAAADLPGPDVPLEFDIPDELVAKLTDALLDAGLLGVKDSAKLMGINFKTPPQAVVDYAERRGAELLGVRKDGSLDEAITESIRRDVRKLTAQAIEKGWSNEQLGDALSGMLGEVRAQMTARTELGFAYNDGTAAVMDEAGVEFVDIADGIGCLPRGHMKKGAEAPAPSGIAGVVEADAEANGQVWSVAQFRANPLGHPNCVRSATAHIGAA